VARTFLRIKLPSPESQRRTKDSIDKFMARAFRFAVREALQAHLSDIRILSGMARGTFLHISRFVGAGLNFPSNPGFKYYSKRGARPQTKTALLGASLSTARSSSEAAKRFKSDGSRYTFDMQTSLRYFDIENKIRWNFSEPFRKTLDRKLREYIQKFGASLMGDIFSSSTRGRGIR